MERRKVGGRTESSLPFRSVKERDSPSLHLHSYLFAQLWNKSIHVMLCHQSDYRFVLNSTQFLLNGALASIA